jgi:hypothetical protein
LSGAERAASDKQPAINADRLSGEFRFRRYISVIVDDVQVVGL